MRVAPPFLLSRLLLDSRSAQDKKTGAGAVSKACHDHRPR